jgi:hypothetical protein
VQFVSIPRAIQKPCSGDAERMNAPGAEARAGVRFTRVTFVATAAFATRGYTVVADCPVPEARDERVYDAGTGDATTIDVGLLYQPVQSWPVTLGAAVGYVPRRDSRFAGALIGAHVWWLRAEGALRLHSIGYDDVRYEPQGELPVRATITARRETKLGGVLRVVIETR